MSCHCRLNLESPIDSRRDCYTTTSHMQTLTRVRRPMLTRGALDAPVQPGLCAVKCKAQAKQKVALQQTRLEKTKSKKRLYSRREIDILFQQEESHVSYMDVQSVFLKVGTAPLC